MFSDIELILADLIKEMSSMEGRTVSWLKVNNRIQVTASHAVTLWPDVPLVASTSNAPELWNYVADTMMRVLGFDMTTGPILLQPGVPFIAPFAYNLLGYPHVLLELKVNGSPIGNIHEIDADGIRVGPYFARLQLKEEFSMIGSGAMAIAINSGLANIARHEFSRPQNIYTLGFKLIEPVVGQMVRVYPMHGRDWIAGLKFSSLLLAPDYALALKEESGELEKLGKSKGSKESKESKESEESEESEEELFY